MMTGRGCCGASWQMPVSSSVRRRTTENWAIRIVPQALWSASSFVECVVISPGQANAMRELGAEQQLVLDGRIHVAPAAPILNLAVVFPRAEKMSEIRELVDERIQLLLKISE